MASEPNRLEELFIKIFRNTMLLLMAIVLAAVGYLLVSAAFEFSQTPFEPAPAKVAPLKDVNMDDLKKWLLEQEKKSTEQPVTGAGDKKSVMFLEDATSLHRCSEGFAKAAGVEVAATTDVAKIQAINELREKVEAVANGRDSRGEVWVKAATAFACKVMEDPGIITLKKEQKVKSVVMPTLNFHLASWDRNWEEKTSFDQREVGRVQAERMAEMARIGAAKAAAISRLIAAGAAFGVFMLLALYLIFAKIESNLREIRGAIQAATR